jgi:hypothetical protein
LAYKQDERGAVRSRIRAPLSKGRLASRPARPDGRLPRHRLGKEVPYVQVMDPVTVKFVQLILAELLGAALCLLGVYMFFRGIAGKSSLLLEGAGLKARLTNGAPGGIITLLGCALIALSLSSTVERTERSSSSAQTLGKWLANSARVTDRMNYEQVIDTIVGRDSNVRFVPSFTTPDKPTTVCTENLIRV